MATLLEAATTELVVLDRAFGGDDLLRISAANEARTRDIRIRTV